MERKENGRRWLRILMFLTRTIRHNKSANDVFFEKSSAFLLKKYFFFSYFKVGSIFRALSCSSFPFVKLPTCIYAVPVSNKVREFSG
jgi:hypothetical protein